MENSLSCGRSDVPLSSLSPVVQALPTSCVGHGTGDSALHPVLLASFLIVVPAVLGLIVPHPALVSRLTSPRLIPSRGRPLPTLCALVANREECDPCLVPGISSNLSLALLLLSSVQDLNSLVRRIQPDLSFCFGDKLTCSLCNLHCICPLNIGSLVSLFLD